MQYVFLSVNIVIFQKLLDFPLLNIAGISTYCSTIRDWDSKEEKLSPFFVNRMQLY